MLSACTVWWLSLGKSPECFVSCQLCRHQNAATSGVQHSCCLYRAGNTAEVTSSSVSVHLSNRLHTFPLLPCLPPAPCFFSPLSYIHFTVVMLSARFQLFILSAFSYGAYKGLINIYNCRLSIVICADCLLALVTL